MKAAEKKIREVVGRSHSQEKFQDRGLLYAGNGAFVALCAEPKAVEWCDYYLGPFATSGPLPIGQTVDFQIAAIHDESEWARIESAIADEPEKPSQTYNGTKIREWKLTDELYVQQYVKRKSFTIIDLANRYLAFVSSQKSDSEWWMEPSRLVRETITRSIEEHLCFVFHTASFELGGYGVALIGPKRAGKTTLTFAALEYEMASFISNDRTYFEVIDGVPYAHGWACTAALGIGTCIGSPTLRELIERKFVSRYPQATLDSRLKLDEFNQRHISEMMLEKVKIELTPSEISKKFNVSVIAGHKLDAVILPNLDPDCEKTSWKRLSKIKAKALLSEQVLTCDAVDYFDWLHLRRMTDDKIEVLVSEFIDDLLEVVPFYELHYWDTKDAANTLHQIFS